MVSQALSTGVSIVLLCALLPACVRIVKARVVKACTGPLYLEHGKSREENDECERRAHDASSIIFVVTRTRRKVEQVLHSVLDWTICIGVLFSRWGCQLRLTENLGASSFWWSRVWIDIWSSIGRSWSTQIFIHHRYLFLVDIIACEITSFYMKLKACCGKKNERNTSSRSKPSKATAVLSRLTVAGYICAHFPRLSLAYNAGTSWRNGKAFAALKENGTVQAWGDSGYGGSSVPADLKDVRSIYSTNFAFAALKEDGTVQAWGSPGSGGSGVPGDLKDVRAIYSTSNAFAALKVDGTVQAWGHSSRGGSGVPDDLKGVRAIYSTSGAFAAVKEDGTVQAWGNSGYGGSGVPDGLKGVRAIYSTSNAFSALKEDGTVQAWGDLYNGGSGVPDGLKDVRAIYSTEHAFAALKVDGTVQAWGNPRNGGVGVPDGLKDVRAIYSTIFAFAAVKEDGTVQAWGNSHYGGSGVPADLKDVRAIYSTIFAFAAVKEDGTVQAWGNSHYGGSGVPADLKDVRAIYSTKYAFAALKENGTVQAWGHPHYGGSGVPDDLQGVRAIYSNSGAFSALKEDGTVQVWGDARYGGSDTRYGGSVPADLKDVKTVFGATYYFADSTAAHHYPCLHNTYGPGFPNCTQCPKDSDQPPPSGRPGIRSDIGSCRNCDLEKGKYSTDGTTCSAECQAGYSLLPYSWFGSTSAQRCVGCFAGSYVDFNSNPAVWKPCKPGKYQNKRGQTSCKKCAAGNYSMEGSMECSACPVGKTVLPGAGYARSDCFNVCPTPGKYGSTDTDECRDCSAGSYSNLPSGVDVCTLCEAGKAQPARGQASCIPCAKGEWMNVNGSVRCSPCPPGSFCPLEGMIKPTKCPVGRYTDTEQRQSCTPCPAGRYQNSTGSAKCFFCPAGTFLEGEGANSSAQCLLCPAGTYADKSGLPQCTRCPTGQVQPEQGQDSCKECILEGKIKTNNEAYTECIDNQALMSSSVVEAMFTKGVGLSLSFGVAALFVCLAGAMHYMKMGYNNMNAENKLGAMGIPQVVLKSAMPGFSFGSEVVLIMGMIRVAPFLGWAMLAARVLHPCSVFVLTFSMFVPDSACLPVYFRNMMTKSPLGQEFTRRKVPPVCVLLLASGCDCTMLQLMPWLESTFYQESMGYPSLDLMLFCMVTKTAQSLVSVVCQSLFVWNNSSLDDPLMTTQAKILFGMSIALSAAQLVMGLMMLLVKWSVLKKVDVNEARQDQQSTAAASLELGDLYDASGSGADGDGRRQSFHNPMHEAAMKERASLVQRLEATERENVQLRSRLQQVQEQEHEQEHEQEQEHEHEHEQHAYGHCQQDEQATPAADESRDSGSGSVGRRDMSIPSVTAKQEGMSRRYSQQLKVARSLMTPIPEEMRRTSMHAAEPAGEESSASAAGLELFHEEGQGQGQQQHYEHQQEHYEQQKQQHYEHQQQHYEQQHYEQQQQQHYEQL
jgi:alpha-tubulin suppressor-like RCC1 family protein